MVIKEENLTKRVYGEPSFSSSELMSSGNKREEFKPRLCRDDYRLKLWH